MSISNAYSLYDVKAQVYNLPFFTSNHALAKRMVGDLVTDPNTMVGRHPSDFKLYFIGVYDDQSGDLAPLKIMEHVVDCVSLVPAPTPDMFSSMGLVRTREEKAHDRANGAA